MTAWPPAVEPPRGRAGGPHDRERDARRRAHGDPLARFRSGRLPTISGSRESSGLDDLQGVSVRVVDEESFGEAERALDRCHDAG